MIDELLKAGLTVPIVTLTLLPTFCILARTIHGRASAFYWHGVALMFALLMVEFLLNGWYDRHSPPDPIRVVAVIEGVAIACISVASQRKP